MAFEDISANRRSSHISDTEIMVGLYVSGDTRSLAVRFPKAVLTRLDWAQRQSVSVKEGTLADAGCLSFQRDAVGYLLAKGSSLGAVVRINLKHLQRYQVDRHETIAMEIVPAQAFGGRAVIILPEWMHYKAS